MFFTHSVLQFNVQFAGGLVQYDDLRISNQSSDDGDALPLSIWKSATVFPDICKDKPRSTIQIIKILTHQSIITEESSEVVPGAHLYNLKLVCHHERKFSTSSLFHLYLLSLIKQSTYFVALLFKDKKALLEHNWWPSLITYLCGMKCTQWVAWRPPPLVYLCHIRSPV